MVTPVFVVVLSVVSAQKKNIVVDIFAF